MRSIAHLPPEEQEHFILCACGEYYDMRDLSAVFRHCHESALPEPEWRYAVRKGDPAAHTRSGRTLGLN
jgi:hypothetical protein